MMRDTLSLRTVAQLLSLFVALFLFSAYGVAQTYLTVELGFEGKLMPDRYAPILIDVHDYQAAEPGRLRITQIAGNEWRGEATLQQELGYAIQSSGRYETVIPVYDPVNPITVELLSPTDTVLASTILNQKSTMRPAPYPVLDKQLPRFDPRAAIIDPTSLPNQWWALDGVENLWIASPLSIETWTAISQWVLAGGSLVLLTGTDFYRMDSPQLRELLPVFNPEIRTTPIGTTYLSGSHPGAVIDLLAEEGFPLLLHSKYGAGNVSLVTREASALSVEDLQEISISIAPAALLSLTNTTDLILRAQPAVTLNSLLVLVMIALLGTLVCVCALIGRRNPKLGWAFLLICALSIAVSSGLASNPTAHSVDIYTTNSHFYLQASVSLLSVSSSSYASVVTSFNQAHKEGLLPLESLPRSLQLATSFDSLTLPGKTQRSLSAGDMRSWHAYGTAASVFDLQMLSESTVRISNSYPTSFDAAWILIEGLVYPMTDIQRGSHDYDLDAEASVRLTSFLAETYSQRAPATLQLIREIHNAFTLSQGVWLIATAEDAQLITGDNTQKVRDITLVVVRAEEANRAI